MLLTCNKSKAGQLCRGGACSFAFSPGEKSESSICSLVTGSKAQEPILPNSFSAANQRRVKEIRCLASCCDLMMIMSTSRCRTGSASASHGSRRPASAAQCVPVGTRISAALICSRHRPPVLHKQGSSDPHPEGNYTRPASTWVGASSLAFLKMPVEMSCKLNPSAGIYLNSDRENAQGGNKTINHLWLPWGAVGGAGNVACIRCTV